MSADQPPASSGGTGGSTPDSVGGIAELYLGNILYALELAALSLDRDAKPEMAAFYRGIARKLAEARGRT